MNLNEDQKAWLEAIANDIARSNETIEKLKEKLFELQVEVRCAITECDFGFHQEAIGERLTKALAESKK